LQDEKELVYIGLRKETDKEKTQCIHTHSPCGNQEEAKDRFETTDTEQQQQQYLLLKIEGEKTNMRQVTKKQNFVPLQQTDNVHQQCKNKTTKRNNICMRFFSSSIALKTNIYIYIKNRKASETFSWYINMGSIEIRIITYFFILPESYYE
jgi:hypothetical protein